MKPIASVIVPVRDGACDLAVQLGSIGAQRLADRVQVVIADNGSTEDILTVAEGLRDAVAELLIVDASDVAGPSHARNAGAAAASAPLLLFLDADDELAPGYIEAMTTALHDHPFVTGTLDFDTLNLHLPAEYRRGFTGTPLALAHGHLPFAPGCSIGITSNLFDRVGGFDERLRGCEDVDFGWRVQYLDARLALVPDAVLRYRLRSGWRSAIRQGYAHARDHPLLFRLHRDRGMVRRGPDEVLRFWGGWLRQALRVRTRSQLQRWLYMTGRRAGLVVGSIEHRVVFL